MLIQADARSIPLRDACVQMVVTSPPYFGLRDYGTATWDGGDPACDHLASLSGTRNNGRDSAASGGTFHDSPHIEPMLAVPFRSICGKCGAVRIDKQIGLEKTPDEYVAQIVAVFREVWRVLKDDGVVWLNIGDSYVGAAGGGHSGILKTQRHHTYAETIQRTGRVPKTAYVDGLKSKDLLGIPWRVAFALQAPQYNGDILNVQDRIWLAAAIDAEGCIFIHKRKAGQSNGQGYDRVNDSYGSGLEVANTSEAFTRRCLEIVGKGSICHQDGHGRKQRLFRWNLRSNECRNVLREVYPYLVAKQQQARLAVGCPSSGKDAEAAHAALIGLHNGFASDVDFKAPESMFGPGWYLRSDVIWNKSNPMPESVTDRPTKSHEYLFLLTKSERYYYDVAAISEPFTPQHGDRRPPGMQGGRFSPAYREAQLLAQDGSTNTIRSCGDRRNKRSVWTVPTMPYAGAHFATMPEALVEPCILAGSRLGDIVFDPFIGSGTVGAVAERLGRRWVGTDLNPVYRELAKKRTAQRGLMFGVPAC